MARILLVEDYDDLRDLIRDLLRSQDHVVKDFDNGEDACRQLKNSEFDLLILDWELPRMDGIDIVKDFRSSGGTAPILMLTGKKAVSDKEACFDAGADDYLTKPFHPKELSARIKALLRRSATGSGADSPAELPAGTIFAERYEITTTLGRGSTGIIYRARHLFLDRQVALKILHPQLVREADSLARFKREAQAVSTLSHPNVIEVYDFGITAQGIPYLVMDYSGGETLLSRLGLCDHLPVREAVPLFIQLCAGLAHAHENGVIHRDVKPGNILIVADETGEDIVKLVDFGIAKIEKKGKDMWTTQNGDVLGSPLYMSPEQCMGAPLDPRSDIFSLGCVMYTALIGSEPFLGENVLDTMYRRTIEDARPFAEVRHDVQVPPDLEAIVLKALARNLEERYQSMNELSEDLQKQIAARA